MTLHFNGAISVTQELKPLCAQTSEALKCTY